MRDILEVTLHYTSALEVFCDILKVKVHCTPTLEVLRGILKVKIHYTSTFTIFRYNRFSCKDLLCKIDVLYDFLWIS